MKKQHLVMLGIAVGSASLSAAGFLFMRPRAAGAAESTPTAPSAPAAPMESEAEWLNEPIQPIRRFPPLNEKAVALGKRLFHDTRLSKDNTISCNSCHLLDQGGEDGRARSIGVNGREGDINTPTVLNSGLNFKQFWDGRAATLEEQVDGPTHDPKEMCSSWEQIVGKLSADPAYVASFKTVFNGPVSPENIRSALATFERSLITPDSRFDKHLRGSKNAITERELKGYTLFKDYGCISCHQGMNAGGNMFQPFGVMGDYFAARGGETKADLGRFNVTGKAEDRHKFRVPGLRNVALTAPYFHDASAATLEDAVRTMAQYQLAQTISDEDVALIVEFLKTLTGEQPAP